MSQADQKIRGAELLSRRPQTLSPACHTALRTLRDVERIIPSGRLPSRTDSRVWNADVCAGQVCLGPLPHSVDRSRGPPAYPLETPAQASSFYGVLYLSGQAILLQGGAAQGGVKFQKYHHPSKPATAKRATPPKNHAKNKNASLQSSFRMGSSPLEYCAAPTWPCPTRSARDERLAFEAWLRQPSGRI
jgi:hypothetical protein